MSSNELCIKSQKKMKIGPTDHSKAYLGLAGFTIELEGDFWEGTNLENVEKTFEAQERTTRDSTYNHEFRH